MTTISLPSGQQITLTTLPDPPKPPDAMQQRRHIASADQVLRGHYHDRPDVLVSGEGYLCYDASDLRRAPHPDCLVAFGMTIPPQAIEDVANGYVISEVGKPPDWVLEVASYSTGRRDYTVKREQYMAYLVGESWRFDATGGRYHDAPLGGDLQQPDGTYARAPLHTEANGLIRAYSPALALELHWDNHRLRFWNPQTGEYLSDMVELITDLATERAARRDAEARSILDRAAREDAEIARAAAEANTFAARAANEGYEVARQEAEARAMAERIAREAANEARREAEARYIQAMERIRRLEEKLRGGNNQ